jgi:hypothetical protein
MFRRRRQLPPTVPGRLRVHLWGGNIEKTNNPADITKTTGLSSAGSAAAVADFQCHVALGTQNVEYSTILMGPD